MSQLIQRLLLNTDGLIDRAIENRKTVAICAGPGTLIFLLLFALFTGSFGSAVLVGFFVMLIEAALAVGIAVLYFRYDEEGKDERFDLADTIEAFVTDTDTIGEWDRFITEANRIPDLEFIRQRCLELPTRYTSQVPGEFCHPDGLEELLPMIQQLRSGIATKFYIEAMSWLGAAGERRSERKIVRDERKAVRMAHRAEQYLAMNDQDDDEEEWEYVEDFEEQDEAPLQPAPARQPARMPGLPIVDVPPLRGPTQSRPETPLPGRFLKKEPEFASAPSKATRKSAKAAKRAAARKPATHEPAMAPINTGGTFDGSVIDQMRLAKSKARNELRFQKKAARMAKAEARARKQAAKLAKKQTVFDGMHQAVPQQPTTPGMSAMPSAPKNPVDFTTPQVKARGLSEAKAIEKVMKAGFTAQDYDRKQHELSRERKGRYVKPSVVAKAITSRKARKARTVATKRHTGRPNVSDRSRVVHLPNIRQGMRLQVRRLRATLLLAIIVGLPFGLYRIPDGAPVTIQGEIHELTFESTSELPVMLRSQFETLFGNRGLAMVAGPKLYVDDIDFERCWADAPAGAEGPFSVWVTAEAQPLLFGGYDIARIMKVERIDHPQVRQAAVERNLTLPAEVVDQDRFETRWSGYRDQLPRKAYMR